MVTQRPLEALFMVRIHVGQPKFYRSFFEIRFAGAAVLLVRLRILLSICAPTFQANHEDADVGGRNAGDAGGLTDGCRANLGELLPRLQPETGNG